MKSKRLWITLVTALVMITGAFAGGYTPGDKATTFRLKNVDGKMVGLDDFKDANGFIVVFTCNTCPYAQAYEGRIIELSRKYAGKGVPVIAVNPNDPEVSPGDSWDEMVKRARKHQYPFPYLFDEKQEVFRMYGATRTPHVYVLKKEPSGLVVQYVGAIDDNYKDASAAKKHYVEEAVDAMLAGKAPMVAETRAIGCSIKVKK